MYLVTVIWVVAARNTWSLGKPDLVSCQIARFRGLRFGVWGCLPAGRLFRYHGKDDTLFSHEKKLGKKKHLDPKDTKKGSRNKK